MLGLRFEYNGFHVDDCGEWALTVGDDDAQLR